MPVTPVPRTRRAPRLLLPGLALAVLASLPVAGSSLASGGAPAAAGAAGQWEHPSHVSYTPPAGGDHRRNIVLITTDDQALTDMRWMPKTRRWLGRTGVTFRNMVSPHPLCCPARAEIITGQYAQNNGVHTNAGPYGGLPALRHPDNTLAWWLQRDGYQTGMVGKYLNGYNKDAGVPRGWDHWNVATSDGFGYYGYEMYNDGDPRFYGPQASAGNAYSSDVIRNSTVGLIHDWSGTDRPFFIWSSYYAPHGVCGDNESCSHPPVPAHRYAADYSGVRSPSRSKPSFNEADVSDKPRVIRNLQKIRPHAAQHLFSQRIRALEAVDEGVAATMRALKETGELDNTVVLFTSDNGYLVGEHRYKGKVLPYREALRVPLLVRGPGVPRHHVRRQPVTTVDLSPTILDLAGSRPGRVQDGRSIWPFVRSGSHRRADDTILIQAGGQPRARKVTPWMYRGVWTGRYTFVKWVSHHELELYDHRKDPYELRNVARTRAYAPVVRALKTRVAALKDCHGASCRRVFGRVPHPHHR